MFVVDDSEDVDGLQDAGVALLRAYNYVAQEVDNNYAFQTVISVSHSSAQQCIIFNACQLLCWDIKKRHSVCLIYLRG